MSAYIHKVPKYLGNDFTLFIALEISKGRQSACGKSRLLSFISKDVLTKC